MEVSCGSLFIYLGSYLIRHVPFDRLRLGAGCRSPPPSVLEGMTIPTERKEQPYEARKKYFSEISAKLAKTGLCVTSNG